MFGQPSNKKKKNNNNNNNNIIGTNREKLMKAVKQEYFENDRNTGSI